MSVAGHKAIERWFQLETDTAPPRSRGYLQGANIVATSGKLYSYGYHFELARPLRQDGEGVGWLLNGDRYSPTTTGHQSDVRRKASQTELPTIIVPHRAMNEAGIILDSVRIVDVQDDGWVPSVITPKLREDGRIDSSVYIADGDRAAVKLANEGEASEQAGFHLADYSYDSRDGQPFFAVYGAILPEGVTAYSLRHMLGGSVFTASVREGAQTRTDVRFISGWDDQEARPLYFLAELPNTSRAATYEEAISDLAPQIVRTALAGERNVTRQGDMFAVEPVQPVTTAMLTKAGAVRTKRTSLYGTAHTASEVATLSDNEVYVRGTFYHDPEVIGEGWREKDHARRKISDGKTWHRVTPNTVPRGNGFQAPRAWTFGGNID